VKGIEIDFSEKVTKPYIFFRLCNLKNVRMATVGDQEVINWHSHWIVFIVKLQKNASETQS